jgi:hypothetical protein
VDLSLSFFIPVFFLPPYKLRVIAEEQSRKKRQLIGITPVSPIEEFSLIFTAPNGHDVEMFLCAKRAPLPRLRAHTSHEGMRLTTYFSAVARSGHLPSIIKTIELTLNIAFAQRTT